MNGMPYYQQRRRFGDAFGRRSGFRSKPGHFGRNHCNMTLGPTTGGTELITTITTALDTPTDRATTMPANAILKKMRVELWATDATPVTGKHQCLMFRAPAATTISTPIGSYVAAATPLSEEGIQIRQLALGTLGTKVIVTGAAFPLHWVCQWRSKRGLLMNASDDINVSILDANATNWTGYCDYTWFA